VEGEGLRVAGGRHEKQASVLEDGGRPFHGHLGRPPHVQLLVAEGGPLAAVGPAAAVLERLGGRDGHAAQHHPQARHPSTA